MGMIRLAAVILAIATIGMAFAAPDASWKWGLPSGVTPPKVPAENAMSPAKVALGRRLFYDADLSIDGTISCATCHEQHRAFADGNRTHGGVRESHGRRNVMPLANVAYFISLTWADPRQQDLADQALVPLTGTHPVEMGMAGQEAELARRLGADPCYRKMFAAAFGSDGIDQKRTVEAIAAFERTLLSFHSPYDRFRLGDSRALSKQAQRGAGIFAQKCATCHAGLNFTDGKYHDIGLHNAGAKGVTDHGLREITGLAQDEGAFRTPSLRNVALTAPYMHDGSIADLASALKAHMEMDRALSLNDAIEILIFLQSLSDQSFITNPALSLPKSACGRAL